MNREIIFRGKRLDNNEWVYGDLVHDNRGGCYVYTNDDCEGLYTKNKVYKDTIGEFTGLLDKNGVKIFEGDIVYVQEVCGWPTYIGVVTCERGNCCVCVPDYSDVDFHTSFYCQLFEKIEVAGDIYDNKDLLKGALKEKYKYC